MPNQFFSPEGDLENYFVTEYWLIDQWVGDTLWSWGSNFIGQVGNNDNLTNVLTPVTTFAGGTNWKQITGSNIDFNYGAIKTDGTLWTWGRGANGGNGNNATTDRFTPVTTFAGGTNWKQVSGGYRNMAAIKTDGTLWMWGTNFGLLGDNTTAHRSTPVTTFAGGNNWKQVSASPASTAAIKTDGTLWVWGTAFALGINDNITDRLTPVTTFSGGTNWKQVSCGRNHIAAVKTDGTLWVWGRNFFGNLGTNASGAGFPSEKPTPVTTFSGGTNWKIVVCNGYMTSAIKTDGTLWIWGRNSYGQLGINNISDPICTPVTTFAGGTNWKQVAPGGIHCAAVKTDGTLWTWGSGNSGALGNNVTANRSTPVTTFAGGTNWKQVASAYRNSAAVTSGTDPTFFIA